MYKIGTLNKISENGLRLFKKGYAVSDDVDHAEGILVRSAKMHDMKLDEELLAIARAGAGVNNIPLDKCAEKGIVVFNTPGANANAVKELVLAGLLLSSRKIVDGVKWVEEQGGAQGLPALVEKNKSKFAGPEIMGKKLGVVGLGAIGVMVANAAYALGMDVIGYDPFISVKSAWGLSSGVTKEDDLDQLIKECDYITVHVPLMEETKHLLCEEKFKMMKKGVRILNFSRGGLVSDSDLVKAIEQDTVACYVTDFPSEILVSNENVVCIPHLGASTPESEENCAAMAVKELQEYLENGNITNSVNYPACHLGKCVTAGRILVHHENVPAMVGQITNILAEKHINICDMNNRSRGKWAYTVMDVENPVTEEVLEAINEIDNVKKVRLIKGAKTE